MEKGKFWFSHLCRTCGGLGLEKLEPVDHGGCSICDTCEECKGRWKDTYWELVERKRKEKEDD